jgi:hypothetical protein
MPKAATFGILAKEVHRPHSKWAASHSPHRNANPGLQDLMTFPVKLEIQMFMFKKKKKHSFCN